jgi:hypothetical protein
VVEESQAKQFRITSHPALLGDAVEQRWVRMPKGMIMRKAHSFGTRHHCLLYGLICGGYPKRFSSQAKATLLISYTINPPKWQP